MGDWWQGLSGLNQAFYAAAAFFSAFFVWQFIAALMGMGGDVRYNDPHIPQFPKLRKYDFDLKSVDLTPKLLKSMDCAVIVANHSAYDYDMIVKNSKLVVDTRNATANVRSGKSKIVKA